jgi:hypothetical protein
MDAQDRPGPHELLTLTQAAQQAGVSPRTLRRWITRGQLPAVLRLLALAAGSIGVSLTCSETPVHAKHTRHKERLDRVDEDFTERRIDAPRAGLGSHWQLWDDMSNVTG